MIGKGIISDFNCIVKLNCTMSWTLTILIYDFLHYVVKWVHYMKDKLYQQMLRIGKIIYVEKSQHILKIFQKYYKLN